MTALHVIYWLLLQTCREPLQQIHREIQNSILHLLRACYDFNSPTPNRLPIMHLIYWIFYESIFSSFRIRQNFMLSASEPLRSHST